MILLQLETQNLLKQFIKQKGYKGANWLFSTV